MMVKEKDTEESKKSKRGTGFKGMSPERRREISAMGGKKAHQLGVAHKWNSETAKIAGRKGGSVSRRRKKKE
jgi:general stress protein YciG